MSYKPADFFIGAMEFFAIIMPGALLAFLLLDYGKSVFGSLLPTLSGAAERWVAFLVIAYVFGHLLHHVGIILDKGIYNQLYVKKWKKPKRSEKKLEERTCKLMRVELRDDIDMTTAFSWAGSYVRVHSDNAASELERGGADSKFFRSLSFVALVAMVLFMSKSLLFATGGAFLLFSFSIWRFCDLRWKNRQRTYEYFIMLKMAENKKTEKDNDASAHCKVDW